MEDWKAALVQALSDLKQSKIQHPQIQPPQANKERGIAESAPVKIKTIQEQARTSGVTSGVTGRSNVVLPPKPSGTPIFDRSQNSTVGKKPDKGTGRFPLAASIPVSNPVPRKSIGVRTEGKRPISKPLLSSKAVQQPATRAIDPTFNAPDMSKYRIRHSKATGATTQAWQEIGKFVVLNPGENRGRAQCTIGLDFGTAFTKACVQFRGVTYVVDWSLAVPGCTPSLLPRFFHSTGWDLPAHSGEVGESRCGDLKIALDGETRSLQSSKYRCVSRFGYSVYQSLALYYTKDGFFRISGGMVRQRWSADCSMGRASDVCALREDNLSSLGSWHLRSCDQYGRGRKVAFPIGRPSRSC